MKGLANYLTGRRRAGVTLVELMVAMTVITIGVIGSMGSFKYINRAITQSRIKTIAINLAQEQMEVLKNKTYYQLLVTTNTAASTGYSPNFNYDTSAYPPQEITLWGFPNMRRLVNVDYVSVTGSSQTVLPYTSNDPGMKRISVYVTWMDSGGTPRKVQLESYYENPNVATMSSGFTGTVTRFPGGAAVPGALVQVMGSPRWSAYTDASGAYSFQVVPGTYSLVCSSQVYYSTYTPVFTINAGQYPQKNFTLTKIATATVSGMAFVRDHLVISQVVASTTMVSGVNIEYVELYNPTTYTISIGDGSGGNAVKLRFLGESGLGKDINEFALSYITQTVAAGKYYLIGNSFPFTAGGNSPITDALFAPSNRPPCELFGAVLSCIRAMEAGAIQIYDANGVIDTVGWSHGATGKDAPAYEGTAKSMWNGFPLEWQLRRKSEYNHSTPGAGRAYDSGDNEVDFEFISSIDSSFPPYGTNSGVKAPTAGTPAQGAVVVASDGLSTLATVSSTGYFQLLNVATSSVQGTANTLTVTIASNTVLISSAGVVVQANQNKDLGTLILSSSASGGIATGYVFGNGPDYTKRLGNPSIKVGSGGISVNTDSQGFYMLFLPTGTLTITANYGGDNSNYLSSDADVTLTEGTVTELPDFHLSQGGNLKGYVTSGTGALPNIVVQASNGGAIYTDTTDSSGNFYIYVATSAIGYTIIADLDALQSYTTAPTTPLISSVTVAGSVVFAGTITVIGAMGTIAGTVNKDGTAITTGVLVVASTAAVPDPLPTVTAASAPGQAIFYAVSSQANGTYSLDVRSSATETYNMRAFYPVVDANTGAVTYASSATTGVPVSAGVTTPRNFSW